MSTIEKMIAAARGCLNTPFHHQGRKPGTGIDCIGLIVVALRAAGIKVHDRTDYARRPDGKSLVAALIEHHAVPVNEIEAGDVLIFRYDNQPQHAALATGTDSMIHSFAPAGKVVETTIGPYWRKRLSGVYRFITDAPEAEQNAARANRHFSSPQKNALSVNYYSHAGGS